MSIIVWELSLGIAARAFTAYGADMLFKIFCVVVVVELFSGAYWLFREHVDAALMDVDLTVWVTGMIDEAGGVAGDVAVDHCGVAGPKKVFASIFILLLFSNRSAFVFDDAGAFRDIRKRKHAFACL